MPVHRTREDCWRYGTSGKEYCGPGGHAKATKQAQAIHASQHGKGKGKGK